MVLLGAGSAHELSGVWNQLPLVVITLVAELEWQSCATELLRLSAKTLFFTT